MRSLIINWTNMLYPDVQMRTTLLIALYIGFSNGLRGPHHPRGSHHHYSPQKNIKITQDAELLQDATHLKEDIGSMAEHLDFSNMTDEEIEFHYFKVHDVDNNDRLDGLEILNAIQHTYHETELYEDNFPWIIELIDKVLEEDDLDDDGYLGYTEYVLGRQRAHIAQTKRNQARTNQQQIVGK